MKKRKLYEAEQAKISNIKMTLETQSIHLESAATTAEAFQAMSTGKNTMQKINQQIGGVDGVDDVMMDMQDEMHMTNEINTAIGQSIDPMLGAMDDDEMMKELEAMEEADLEQKFNQAETGKLHLPAVPSSRHGLSKNEEEDIRKLQAELAM